MAPSNFSRYGWIALAAGALCAAGAASCRVDIPEGALFPCTTDADCGGGGAVCALRGRSGLCCVRAPEICDGIDNDCDGEVDEDLTPELCYTGPRGTQDVGICHAGQRICAGGRLSTGCEMEVLPASEICNGQDDDCDGLVDEDFNFQGDPKHCGNCSTVCNTSQQCKNGACIPAKETVCDDGVDEDQDGLTDCADPECQNKACGAGCVCLNGGPHEMPLAGAATNPPVCGDGLDNDGDKLVDCDDLDCVGFSCGTGCQCAVGINGTGIKTETICSDRTSNPNTADNDGDGLTDCADPDCEGQSCGPGCLCSGGFTETNCADKIDNDGDSLVDCDDSNCAGKSCGAGCLCSPGFTETNCYDNLDNDGDKLIDCADPDCANQLCKASPATLTCDAVSATCIGCNGSIPPPPEVCTGGGDEDCDGLIDCADADCNLLSCGAGCQCQNAAAHELSAYCADGTDNDRDGYVDCADPDCDQATCGSGCQCRTVNGVSSAHEMAASCADGLDNDRDGLVDCADPDCNLASCGTGCQCRTVNGVGSAHEMATFCSDGLDNDNDTRIDCMDTQDCPKGTPCAYQGSTPVKWCQSRGECY